MPSCPNSRKRNVRSVSPLVGAMVALGQADTTLEKAIGFIAVLLGAANAAGGYVVTERMLAMFQNGKKGN